MLHYRKDLFEQHGLEVPETFDELMEVARFFAEDDGDPDVAGMAMNFQRGSAAGQQFFEWIYSAGGKPWESNYPGSDDPYADQTPLFNSPEGRRDDRVLQRRWSPMARRVWNNSPGTSAQTPSLKARSR
jgi:multiple sugar transport system substrate-binding protein